MPWQQWGCKHLLIACGVQMALQNFPSNDSEPSGRATSVPSQRVALQQQVHPAVPVHA